MTDPSPFASDGPVARFVWPLIASGAGAIASLAFRPWQGMKPTEVSLSVFVSFTFSYFVTPWLIYLIWRDGIAPLRPAGAIYWVTATGSNVLIPRVIRKLGEVLTFIGLRDEGGHP